MGAGRAEVAAAEQLVPENEERPVLSEPGVYRAGEGIRTLDVNLGKVALYH